MSILPFLGLLAVPVPGARVSAAEQAGQWTLPEGRKRRAARIVGELDAEAFLKRLHKAREAN